jgi:hypothetical protein
MELTISGLRLSGWSDSRCSVAMFPKIELTAEHIPERMLERIDKRSTVHFVERERTAERQERDRERNGNHSGRSVMKMSVAPPAPAIYRNWRKVSGPNILSSTSMN